MERNKHKQRKRRRKRNKNQFSGFWLAAITWVFVGRTRRQAEDVAHQPGRGGDHDDSGDDIGDDNDNCSGDDNHNDSDDEDDEDVVDGKLLIAIANIAVVLIAKEGK